MAIQRGQNTRNLQADKKTEIVHISLLLDFFVLLLLSTPIQPLLEHRLQKPSFCKHISVTTEGETAVYQLRLFEHKLSVRQLLPPPGLPRCLGKMAPTSSSWNKREEPQTGANKPPWRWLMTPKLIGKATTSLHTLWRYWLNRRSQVYALSSPLTRSDKCQPFLKKAEQLKWEFIIEQRIKTRRWRLSTSTQSPQVLAWLSSPGSLYSGSPSSVVHIELSVLRFQKISFLIQTMGWLPVFKKKWVLC